MALVFKYTAADLENLEAKLENIKNQIAFKQHQLSTHVDAESNDQANQISSEIKALDVEMMKMKEHIERSRFARDYTILQAKFNDFVDKNNCLRVRMLEWVATKLEGLAKKLRDYAFKITTPCAIKLPAKKEDYLIDERGNYNGILPLMGNRKK